MSINAKKIVGMMVLVIMIVMEASFIKARKNEANDNESEIQSMTEYNTEILVTEAPTTEEITTQATTEQNIEPETTMNAYDNVSNQSSVVEEVGSNNRKLIFDADSYENYFYTDIFTKLRNEDLGWRYWWADKCQFGKIRAYDSMGNKYSSGILLKTPNGYVNDEGSGIIEYIIGGEYKELNCKFFIEKDSRNTDCNFQLNVYGDDELLYSSDTISGGSNPVEVNVNVTGKNKLTFEVCWDLIEKSSDGDYICISDVCLSN